ncbi:hypothetical protein MY1884_009464 [Beauveria asiatica]
MRFTAAFIAAAAPCIVSATVYLDWSFSQFPADGLQDVTFPFSMAAAKNEEGYYFAQQFNFNGIEAVSYAGVQPRPDRNGQSIVHATFSTFQDGATTAHPNCYPGADGEAPGASCALDVPGDYAHTWNVTVFKVDGTTWKGVLVDADTGKSHEIGTWTLPSGAGSMQAQRDGFIEYYLSNAPGGPSCPKLPFTNVTYLNPTSNTAGASGGVLGKPYETGDCNGQADFAAKEVSDGLNMVYGKFGKPQKQQDPDSIKAKPTSAVYSYYYRRYST